jgi:hypothetical protein
VSPVSVAAPPSPRTPARRQPAGAARPADDAAPIALAIALAGWVGWLFGYLAERDTGLPDGTGCTGVAGQAYRACMRSSEQGAVVSWSLAGAMATCALTLVVFDLCRRGRSRSQRLVDAAVAMVAAGLAAACAAAAQIGAGGGWFDGTVSAARWRGSMAVGAAAGVAAGGGLLLLWRRRARYRGRSAAARVAAAAPRPQHGPSGAWVAVIVVAGLGAAFMLFAFGEVLTGSDDGTIDSYNASALTATHVYPGAHLKQERVFERRVSSGRLLRFRSRLYATSAPAREVIAYYRRVGVPRQQGVVVEVAAAGTRWAPAPGVRVVDAIRAADERTVFVLSAGQRVRHGIF